MWFGCAPVGGYKSYFCFLVAVKNGDFGVFNRFGGVNSVLPELNKCPWRAGYPLHFVVVVTIERHGRGMWKMIPLSVSIWPPEDY